MSEIGFDCALEGCLNKAAPMSLYCAVHGSFETHNRPVASQLSRIEQGITDLVERCEVAETQGRIWERLDAVEKRLEQIFDVQAYMLKCEDFLGIEQKRMLRIVEEAALIEPPHTSVKLAARPTRKGPRTQRGK